MSNEPFSLQTISLAQVTITILPIRRIVFSIFLHVDGRLLGQRPEAVGGEQLLRVFYVRQDLLQFWG